MNQQFDDSNWREEYKNYTRNKMELDLLENGPANLSQSWHLQALYSNWKKIKVIKNLNTQLSNRHLKNFTKNGVSMKTYRIEEEITSGMA